MAALPVDFDAEKHRTRHHRARRYRNFPGRHRIFHVRPVASVDVNPIRLQIRQKITNAAVAHFLGLLKHANDLTAPFILVLGQNFRRDKEHRRVRVMPARMGHAGILGNANFRPGQICRTLLYRKRIDIRPQQNGTPRFPAVNRRKNSAERNLDIGNPPRVQPLIDVFQRPKFLLRKLRILMKMPPQRNQQFLLGSHQFLNIHISASFSTGNFYVRPHYKDAYFLCQY